VVGGLGRVDGQNGRRLRSCASKRAQPCKGAGHGDNCDMTEKRLPGPTPEQLAATFLAWRKLPPAQRAGILAAMLRDLLSGNVKHGQTEPSTPARPKLRAIRGKP
jgi:hypothetical protein